MDWREAVSFENSTAITAFTQHPGSRFKVTVQTVQGLFQRRRNGSIGVGGKRIGG